ncbi:uncharacterized protein G2W53_025655 [Senna tora]|uniref:Uncharacterized protein n=1 Tax=Senna tora TaxID=362788 RepID=A0A834TED7_9FABA|nr:uncharacterized protein G2W53_025655 [Senna tora]
MRMRSDGGKSPIEAKNEEPPSRSPSEGKKRESVIKLGHLPCVASVSYIARDGDRILSGIYYVCKKNKVSVESEIVVLHTIWRCRNVRVMEGRHIPPISAIKTIDASWRNFNEVFSNLHQRTNLQSFTTMSKRWSTTTSLPNSGIVVVTATRKFKPRGSIRGLRKILLKVLVNNQLLAHMVYTLRDHQDLKIMHLLAIRKGIQLAINCTSRQDECNIIVFRKGMVDLLTNNYKNNFRFQVVGTDIANNLLHSFTSSRILFLRSITFLLRSLHRYMSFTSTVPGWSSM